MTWQQHLLTWREIIGCDIGSYFGALANTDGMGHCYVFTRRFRIRYVCPDDIFVFLFNDVNQMIQSSRQRLPFF